MQIKGNSNDSDAVKKTKEELVIEKIESGFNSLANKIQTKKNLNELKETITNKLEDYKTAKPEDKKQAIENLLKNVGDYCQTKDNKFHKNLSKIVGVYEKALQKPNHEKTQEKLDKASQHIENIKITPKQKISEESILESIKNNFEGLINNLKEEQGNKVYKFKLDIVDKLNNYNNSQPQDKKQAIENLLNKVEKYCPDKNNEFQNKFLKVVNVSREMLNNPNDEKAQIEFAKMTLYFEKDKPTKSKNSEVKNEKPKSAKKEIAVIKDAKGIMQQAEENKAKRTNIGQDKPKTIKTSKTKQVRKR